MQVRLKVVGGKNDGKEIRIAGSEFVIGRGEEAHLKPTSELVSRRHCSLKIDNKKLVIADEGSRNGTFVNGNQIHGPYVASAGDLLRVGRLQFEIVIDVAQPSDKRPVVAGVADAIHRTATATRSSTDSSIEDSISGWLTDDSTGSISMQDTTQLSLEDTRAILAEAERKARQKEVDRANGKLPSVDESGEQSASDSKKPRKLPPGKGSPHESSKGAADDVLRKFFKRR